MTLLGHSLDVLLDIQEVFEAKGSVIVLFDSLSATCSAMLSQAEICVLALQATFATVLRSEK